MESRKCSFQKAAFFFIHCLLKNFPRSCHGSCRGRNICKNPNDPKYFSGTLHVLFWFHIQENIEYLLPNWLYSFLAVSRSLLLEDLPILSLLRFLRTPFIRGCERCLRYLKRYKERRRCQEFNSNTFLITSNTKFSRYEWLQSDFL